MAATSDSKFPDVFAARAFAARFHRPPPPDEISSPG
jgi:hypothetical protein